MQRGIAIVAAAVLFVAGMAPSTQARELAQVRADAPVPGAPNCSIFPANNVWNTDISSLPVAADSAAMIQSIGLTTGLHPDFGSYLGYGIPYNVVSGSQTKVPVSFDYADESDPGPYPIPANPKVEGGSDAHMLIVDSGNCYLYELYAASESGGKWSAGSGAIWNLRSNALRPDTWTSADAAGLPILPGLVRYDELASGVIDHALRFTAVHTCKGHIYPARHDASSLTDCSTYPPMGLRVRLKASVNIRGFSPQVQVLLTALKQYGMILADNGSNWYISGASDPRINDDDFHKINQITGADFEVVDTSRLVNGPNPAAGGSAPTATATPVPPAAGKTNTPVSEATSPALMLPKTIVLTPVADAYVRDGTFARTNYGSAKVLMAQWSATAGNNRETYLRFDLRGVPGSITAATLLLYGRHDATGAWSGTDSLYPVASTTWAESGSGGITWNTRPAAGETPLSGTHVGETSQYYGWNTGWYVVAQQGSTGMASFMVAMDP